MGLHTTLLVATPGGLTLPLPLALAPPPESPVSPSVNALAAVVARRTGIPEHLQRWSTLGGKPLPSPTVCGCAECVRAGAEDTRTLPSTGHSCAGGDSDATRRRRARSHKFMSATPLLHLLGYADLDGCEQVTGEGEAEEDDDGDDSSVVAVRKVPEIISLAVSLRILGGKGGFGANLRASGGRMASKKTTNFDACRDLSGRRLKTITDAKKVAMYTEYQEQQKRKRDQQELDKIAQGLASGSAQSAPKVTRFDDAEFLNDHSKALEDVKGAVLKALTKGGIGSTAASSKATVNYSSASSFGSSASSHSASGSGSESLDDNADIRNNIEDDTSTADGRNAILGMKGKGKSTTSTSVKRTAGNSSSSSSVARKKSGVTKALLFDADGLSSSDSDN